MSAYQALYRKYRPQTFDDVSGQLAVTQTLKTQVVSGKLSHAYLFTGSRGTGKTSCAKILAKAVNCLHPDNGNPCNQCEACRAIDAGSCMDVLEIDAASNNGVDNVRDLRDDAVYSPSQVRKRVYIVDEVHMLSLSAFNALLKIIEEPPEHLLFILATTELHKVPATILSRCQRFSFRRISQEDIAARLQYVAYQENIDLDEGAARVLARLADGAMRDGLSLLDQCASASTGELTAEKVYDCLGIAGEQKCGALLSFCADRDTGKALSLFHELYSQGKDLGALLDELESLLRDLLILKTAPSTHCLWTIVDENFLSTENGLSRHLQRSGCHALRRGPGFGNGGAGKQAVHRRAGADDADGAGYPVLLQPQRGPADGRGNVHCAACPSGAEPGRQGYERPAYPAGGPDQKRQNRRPSSGGTRPVSGGAPKGTGRGGTSASAG